MIKIDDKSGDYENDDSSLVIFTLMMTAVLR
jgi:hypothetical protein